MEKINRINQQNITFSLKQYQQSMDKINPDSRLLRPLSRNTISSQSFAETPVVRAPNYIASLAGPILMTGPHTGLLKKPRNAEQLGNLCTQRNHKIERHVASILAGLYHEIHNLMGADSASMIMWSNAKTKKVNRFDLDPNCLLNHQLEHSPFH